MKDIIRVPKQKVQFEEADIATIPGDKSISHRAAILGGISDQSAQFKGYSLAEDCLHSLQVMADLGVPIHREGRTVQIQGVGLRGLKAPKTTLNVGNSGTLIRLILGVLAAQSFKTVITGDQSIQSRPMKRIIDPLTQMGAHIEGQEKNGDIMAPLTIYPVKKLTGILYDMPVASAQVKSAILLAGLYADSAVIIRETVPSRDHTERFLRSFGQPVSVENPILSMTAVGRLHHQVKSPELLIPADLSSALFMIVLGLFMPESITLRGIGMNPSRRASLDVLIQAGASLEFLPCEQQSFEPVADIVVSKSTLKDISISGTQVPNLIDEIPILSVAAFVSGRSISVRDAAELRVKESDRIQGICRLMSALGARVQEFPDGFDIQADRLVPSFDYDAMHDHRLAMSAIIAALILGIEANVLGSKSIATSFPNFFEILEDLGFRF